VHPPPVVGELVVLGRIVTGPASRHHHAGATGRCRSEVTAP
jgi:hypothetical protein